MTTEYAPGTPSWLRARNQRIGLTLLLEQGPLTRNQISSLSGLSRPTTNLIVSHLEEIGLVQAIGEISGGRGPYATNYAVRTQTVLAVAVDVDGRRVRSMVVDAVGTDYPVAHGMLSDTPEADLPGSEPALITSALAVGCRSQLARSTKPGATER